MLSELVTVVLVAVMAGPRLVQLPERRFPEYCTWYCWPGTAVHVKIIWPVSVSAAGRSNGLGTFTVNTATVLVLLHTLVITTT